MTIAELDKQWNGHRYLCSNPNCMKIFSRPKIIKYHVCPACQTLVNTAKSADQTEPPISFASKKPVKRKKPKKVEANNAGGLTIEVKPERVEPSDEELRLPVERPESDEKPILLEQVQTLQQEKIEVTLIPQTTTLETETDFQYSPVCRYGFGYLNHREKGEKIPDLCIECSKSISCMLSEYYKKEESAKEIKKWYSL